MKKNFDIRPTYKIEHGDNNPEIIYPHLTVLSGFRAQDNSKRNLDFGALCYRSRQSVAHKAHKAYEGTRVDEETLDRSRLPTLRKLIEDARDKPSFLSATGFYFQIKTFFDWVDSQENRYELQHDDSALAAYRNYTKQLEERIRESSIRGRPLAVSHASKLQAAARRVIATSIDVNEMDVANHGNLIRATRNRHHLRLDQPSADMQAKFFASLINFIDEAHRILVEGAPFPMRLESDNGQTRYLYSLHKVTLKSMTANESITKALITCPQFPSWEQLKSALNKVETGHGSRFLELNYNSALNYHKKSNIKTRSNLRLKLSRHAITAGMLAFIATTGCNLSVAQTINTEDSKIVQTTQGKRFYGVKKRAHGKKVAPEFGARFTPTFLKILQIREWALNGMDTKRLFALPSTKRPEPEAVTPQSLQYLRKLFAKFYPHAEWITASQWRKNVSYQYIKKSNADIHLTAEKLSNTVNTIASSYARPSLDEYAGQISALFEGIHSSAISRARKTEHIPVRISINRDPDTSTSVGDCTNQDSSPPSLDSGFTELAPPPSCRAPETCLFCKYYSVHADEDDIRRLLSLRYIIKNSKSAQDHQAWESQFAPIIHRIDEILQAIAESDKTLDNQMAIIKEEVEHGYLDPFWAIHFDTLVTLGEVT